MATLYELDAQLRNFDLDIDEETGEILNADELEAIELARDTKIENIALFIKNLKSDAEAYKKEKEAFYKKEQQATKKAEYLREYLQMFLNGDKFKSDRVNITYRASESVAIDPLQIDNDFLAQNNWLVAQAPKIDKMALKKALKDGVEIRGA